MIEIEWQFAVRDLDRLGRWLAAGVVVGDFVVTPTDVRRIADAYRDTADWRVWRSGYALRIRRSNGRVETTLKAAVRGGRGLARRCELTERLSDARPATLRAARGRVGGRVRRLVGSAPLRLLFALQTTRRAFAVTHGARVVAEIALDRTRIAAPGGRTHRLERLEVEVKAGAPALVGRFVATLRRRRHLTIATRSKFEEGLRTARLRPPPRR